MKKSPGIVKYLIIFPMLFLIPSAILATPGSPSKLLAPLSTSTWTGAVSTSWATSGNWSGGVPTSSTNVTIPSNLARYPVVSSTANAASITLSGSGTAPTLTISGSTLTIAGNLNINAGTVTQSGGTIFVTAGGINVGSKFTQTGGTLLSSVTLSIISGGLITQSGGIIHMAGNTGTSPTDNISISPNGSITQSAGEIRTLDITIQNNGNYTQSGTGLLKLYQNYMNNGTFSATGGTIEFAGNGSSSAWPSSTATDQFNDVLIDASVSVTIDKTGTIKISGDWTNDGFVLILTSSNVIEFNGSGPQAIGGAGTTIFYGLYLTGTGVKTAAIAILAFVLDNGGTGNTPSVLDMNTNSLIALSIDNAGATIKFSGATNGMAISTGTIMYSGTTQTLTPGSYNTIDVVAGGTKTAGGTVTTSGLNLNSGATFDIAGNTLTVNGAVTGAGVLKGSSTSNLTIGGAAGTLYFDQTSAATRSMNNLSFNSGSSATLGSAVDIYGTMSLTASTVNLNAKNVTLRSNNAGTASIGNLTGSTLSGATNVTVERYIPANPRRSWRFLSAPTSGQTIHQAWQENQTAGSASLSGYGAQITSGSAAWSANGFDFHSNSASLMTYVPATGTYAEVSSTANAIASTSGYVLFIRGDRTIVPSNTTGITSTTLRTTGTIYQGNTAAITVPQNKYALVSNPYPSRIDLTQLTKGSNIQDVFYVWDPLLVGNFGVGGFQTFTRSGGSYVVTPGGASSSYPSGPYSTIESGQAFFVRSTGSTSNTVSFTEAAKAAGSRIVFRPGGVGEQLVTNLYTTAGGVETLADGTLNLYDDNYSNDIDNDDAVKLSNFGINFGTLRNGQKLVVEQRATIQSADTIFLNMESLSQQAYRFEFIASNLDHPGLLAKLVDNYTNATTPVKLNDTTRFDFSVNSDAASANAGRFMIVFYSAAPLPVTFTGIKAYQQSKDVAVEWTVANQLNIKQYEVERSANGSNFSKIATQAAVVANGGNATYKWLDTDPAAGDNFYRVRSIDIDGAAKYTSIVKVSIAKANAGINIYPNPVVGNTMGLQFNNIEKGTYSLELYNAAGQKVLSTVMQYVGGSATKMIELPAGMAPGVYQLVIIGGNNVKTSIKVVKN